MTTSGDKQQCHSDSDTWQQVGYTEVKLLPGTTYDLCRVEGNIRLTISSLLTPELRTKQVISIPDTTQLVQTTSLWKYLCTSYYTCLMAYCVYCTRPIYCPGGAFDVWYHHVVNSVNAMWGAAFTTIGGVHVCTTDTMVTGTLASQPPPSACTAIAQWQ